MISLPVVLAFAAVMFGIGLYGVLGQTNAIMVIMGVELMLGAAEYYLLKAGQAWI